MTTKNCNSSYPDALSAARGAIADICRDRSLTPQEQLDLLGALCAEFGFEQADRVTGWKYRSFGILNAIYVSGTGHLHDLVGSGD
ncbi:hypothetical protein [Swaminathania salitolerans]|uniref:Uncharacterized protein n=1 Tax=Swaminathania salitolerans TaxID=182838 RepID=A0A511BNH4_9PROT|nr:hypothetical protein [Swaminathania salitolerans]GBQ14794.1 hypothetical protein AA21291_1958 [Swaminathania salitolerans LMG 21291]GEL01890.1 hypothetical protein SSA02_10530 [Swaminathania salitolerans]